MVGWWNGRELRALLARHEAQLGAVWPALRDSAPPPSPTPDQLPDLAELLRAAGRSGGDRGARIDGIPETAVIILVLALCHRLQPALTPPPLRLLVDPAVPLDADGVNSTGRMTARFAELARDERTPRHLRRWCADAALLCGTRCLSGSAPDDPRLGVLHQVVSGAAEQRFADTGDLADEDTALTHARASYDHRAPGSCGAEEATRLAQLLAQRCSRLRDASPMGDVPDLVRAALDATDPTSPHWLAYAATATGAFVTATAHEKKSVELLDAALELQRAIREHPNYGLIRDRMEPTCAGLLAQRFARRRDPEILQEALEIYETLYAAQPRRHAADLGRHLQYRYQLRGDPADRRRALDLMGEGLTGPESSHQAVSSYGASAVHEFRETGEAAVIERALRIVTPLTEPGGPHAEASPAHRAIGMLLLARVDYETAPDLGPAEAAARRALSLARSAADRALALGMLANVLVYRYRFGHDLAVLDEAIAHSRQGFEELPDEPDTELLTTLRGSLIMALSERHTRTRHLAALREAVTVAEQLAADIPQFEAETPIILGNVATLLIEYARQNRDQGSGGAELDRAQRLVERALAGTEPGHDSRHHLVSALGGVLLARLQQPGVGIEDAEAAVRHYETALADPPADPLRRASLYGNLAHALRERHRHGGDREDLDIALAAARKCAHLIPAGHPLHGGALGAVSWVLRDIARADGGYDAIRDQALTVNAE
ncbi:MAG: hypothetical protein HOV70_19845, partial [Streptomyces sp.]|nr:hypothetical protein [Streptomyces sp.]